MLSLQQYCEKYRHKFLSDMTEDEWWDTGIYEALLMYDSGVEACEYWTPDDLRYLAEYNITLDDVLDVAFEL